MTQQFYNRLQAYYLDVCRVLRGEASAASVFPNSSDIGESREKIYARFLQQHAPSKCNVFLGGFLFHENGEESGQIDIIINIDTTPRFNLHNIDGGGKSFSPVEGSIGAVSVKSSLDKSQLFDALKNISSIPSMMPIGGRLNPLLCIDDYEDWPYKIIYATDGPKIETMLENIKEFYEKNSEIQLNRVPNLIHVAGKYIILRGGSGIHAIDKDKNTKEYLQNNTLTATSHNSDINGLIFATHELQRRAVIASHMLYSYNYLLKCLI